MLSLLNIPSIYIYFSTLPKSSHKSDIFNGVQRLPFSGTSIHFAEFSWVYFLIILVFQMQYLTFCRLYSVHPHQMSVAWVDGRTNFQVKFSPTKCYFMFNICICVNIYCIILTF